MARYRYAVVGRSASAKLVEEYQRARTDIVENRGGFVHLDHEGGFAKRYVVARSHAGEDFVDNAYARALGGHEAADLGEYDVERSLAQQRRFTRHVILGEHHDLRAVVR